MLALSAFARAERVVWWIAEVGISLILVSYAFVIAILMLDMDIANAFARVYSECELLILSIVLMASTALYCIARLTRFSSDDDEANEEAQAVALRHAGYGILATLMLVLFYMPAKYLVLADGISKAPDRGDHVDTLCYISLVILLLTSSSICLCAMARNNVDWILLRRRVLQKSPTQELEL